METLLGSTCRLHGLSGTKSVNPIHIRNLLKLCQQNINIVRVHNLKGCINVLALDGQGRQLAVSYDEEISLYDVSKFGTIRPTSVHGQLSEVWTDAEEMTHLHRLMYVKVEGVIPFVSGIHYVDADMLIVCFLDPRMGIAWVSLEIEQRICLKFTQNIFDERSL